LGVGLVWVGFVQPFGKEKTPTTESPDDGTLAPTPTTVLYPTFTSVPVSPSPLPTDTPVPTAVPPTAPPVAPSLVAGADGVNVRSGPGTNYTRLGYLEPGAKAEVTGRYGDWWQIRHNGGLGWVFGELVTASNADSVAQVEPPPSPTSAPATAVPPTATAAPQPTATTTTDIRGLHPDGFQVEGAPGPYAVGQAIWFNMWITNKTNTTVEYASLGVWVQETGAFQKSWVYSEFSPYQVFFHRDQMHDKISAPGTYHLWMAIEFRDGVSEKLMGPVEVIVQ